jgi:hypothetical protein
MKQPKATIEQLRKGINEFQGKLLTEVWQTFRTKGEWPILRRLYRDYGKEAVRDALSVLGRSIGWEERGSGRWGHYRLSLVGTLLTPQGPELQNLLARFFQIQRQLFEEAPEKENTTSADISRRLNLTKDETTLLGDLLSIGNFGAGQNKEDKSWNVSTMDEAADFCGRCDFNAKVDEWACRFYVDDRRVFQDQQAYAQSFADPFSKALATGSAQSPHPAEIAVSLERLREKYPDAKKLGFLIMRFSASRAFDRIVQAIKATAEQHGLVVIRADEIEFHADLWGNVRTLLHGCGFGIAVYDRIESNEPNANIGLEVGYLMAMNKPVLLLKDRTLASLQSDLTGKLYKTFDPHNAKASIPRQMTAWLQDNGIIVPVRR